jgi:hypothetical protein
VALLPHFGAFPALTTATLLNRSTPVLPGKVPHIETSLFDNLTALSPSQEAPKTVVLLQAPFCREKRSGKSAIAQAERSGTFGINVVKITSYPHWLQIPLLSPPLWPIEPSPPCYGRWRKARASRCTPTGGPSPS